MSDPNIETMAGGGWRNCRAHGVRCRAILAHTYTPNNDLGFRTFRNFRERKDGA